MYILHPCTIFWLFFFFFRAQLYPLLCGVIWRGAVGDSKETDSWSHPDCLGQVFKKKKKKKDNAGVSLLSLHSPRDDVILKKAVRGTQKREAKQCCGTTSAKTWPPAFSRIGFANKSTQVVFLLLLSPHSHPRDIWILRFANKPLGEGGSSTRAPQRKVRINISLP